MKYVYYILLSTFILISCNDDNIDDTTTNSLLKRTDLQFSQYGNMKSVTYYENNKPKIDSAFYFDDDYPELFQKKRIWSYNDNGLVSKITSIDSQNGERFTKITYDSQERITIINHNDAYRSTFEYNGMQITKKYIHLAEGTVYTTHFEIDQNNNFISEINLNGIQTASVQYDDSNNVSQHTSPQISNLHFSYLDTTIPGFLKHPEFGENRINYILFAGNLNYRVLVDNGTNFISQVSHDNINWENLNYIYEFNDEFLPIYIKSSNNGFVYRKSYLEYE